MEFIIMYREDPMLRSFVIDLLVRYIPRFSGDAAKLFSKSKDKFIVSLILEWNLIYQKRQETRENTTRLGWHFEWLHICFLYWLFIFYKMFRYSFDVFVWFWFLVFVFCWTFFAFNSKILELYLQIQISK